MTDDVVSTHSHPKVAAQSDIQLKASMLSFNTQPPEGGCEIDENERLITIVSTHSHPKVAAYLWHQQRLNVRFQHTATRRWLLRHEFFAVVKFSFNTQPPEGGCTHNKEQKRRLYRVSTHSHPKVAAYKKHLIKTSVCSFNTQPPEGGC